MVQHQEGAKMAAKAAGAIQRLVPIFQKWPKDPRTLSVTADLLHQLCHGDAEGKLTVWNSGGPVEITAALNKAVDEKLILTLARLLQVLSTCPSNKERLVECAAFEILAKRLNTNDRKLFQVYLTTMRNLSDAEADFVRSI